MSSRSRRIITQLVILSEAKDLLESAVRRERGNLRRYSIITVDCPVSSNLFRQRMFLHAIMSSLRTI